jgi:hypothetical protein
MSFYGSLKPMDGQEDVPLTYLWNTRSTGQVMVGDGQRGWKRQVAGKTATRAEAPWLACFLGHVDAWAWELER